jgi:NADH-quinone oxidoreductase subunit L
VPRLHRALAARLGCDELYAATLGRLNAALAAAANALDRSVWDGCVRLLARLGAYAGLVSRETDEEVLNGGFNAAGDGLRASGRAYARTQTGDAHGYVWMLAAGFVLLALAVLLGGAR